ncbi:MAG TPA: MazG nucleotide pyrophosphohydrolase domain-containing protein [Candidatus Saccharimonadales bacterium]|nr:MazG nucleotide pyrophosphohydrolase domain-containing protein [Candidatus Saccharimonadales bacterium]
MSDLKDLQVRAIEISNKYAELNKKRGNNPWGPKDRAMGFVTDVGELMELVMAKENMRDIDDVDAKLKHELADCLWSILVLAGNYQIDLEAAFMQTMDELTERIAKG